MSKPLFSGIPITAKDWMRFAFYDDYVPRYDGYYLRLANSLFEDLYSPESALRDMFKRDAVKELVIIMTRHFEDFINEIGIWEAVRKKNEHFYGKTIPFYDLSEYDNEYLNPEDFSYLAWHTLCDNSKKVLDPLNIIMLELGQLCYDFFEERIEEAPVNTFYDKWLIIDDDVPFFELKSKIIQFAYANYLTGPYSIQLLQAALDDMFENENELSERNSGLMVYMLQDQYALFQQSTWGALTGPEWFSEIIVCSDFLAKEIRGIRKRVVGEFFFEGYDQKDYFFQYLRTKRHFKITRKSIEFDLNIMKPGKEFGVFTLVPWKNEWWLSGTYVSWDATPEKIDGLDPSVVSPPFYGWTLDQQTLIRNLNEDMESAFIHYFGSRLITFPDKKMLDKGMNRFSEWWNVVKDDPEKRKNIPSPVFREDLTPPSGTQPSIGLPLNHTEYTLFYDPGVGYLISDMVPHLIRLMLKDTLTAAEKMMLFTHITSKCSPGLTKELIILYGQKHIQLPIGNDPDILANNLLVFHHLYNPDGSGEPIPIISLV